MNQDHDELVRLYNRLTDTFNESEIRDLCFHLKIDYEDLPGYTRKDKAREIVEYLRRHGRVSEITQLLEKIRPTRSTRQGRVDQIPQTLSPLPGVNRKMKWFSPFVVSTLTILVGSSFWMWAEPGFEPLLSVIAALIGFIAAILYERNHVKVSSTMEIFLSLLIIIIFVVGVVSIRKPTKGDQDENQPTNKLPIVDTIVINPQIVRPGETATIIVVASDPDGDVLAYYWTTQQGTVPPGSTGPQVIYTAPTNPNGGMDTITVTVQDGQGGVISEKKNIVIEYSD